MMGWAETVWLLAVLDCLLSPGSQDGTCEQLGSRLESRRPGAAPVSRPLVGSSLRRTRVAAPTLSSSAEEAPFRPVLSRAFVRRRRPLLLVLLFAFLDVTPWFCCGSVDNAVFHELTVSCSASLHTWSRGHGV